MTKQLCKNCKHLETDGMFGIFCGVGGDNTKYDCPKYEKVRKMTEKRFTIVVTGSDGSFHYWDKFTDERITSTLELENKLNELSDENEKLKEEYDSFRLKVALSIQYRINWLKKQIWDNTDRISELQSLKKELKLNGDVE